MRLLLILALGIATIGALVGCGSNETPEQKTPPPSKEQLGTGQQFGYQPPEKK